MYLNEANSRHQYGKPKSERDTIMIVDSILFYINVQKDAAIRPALHKLVLDYYKEEHILAAKECLHEKLI